MLAIIYYKLREFEALEVLLVNFKSCIRRQKELTYHWENYSNFIYFFIKLLRLGLKNLHSQIQLIRDLEQQTKVAEKEWLLSKFSAL